MRLIDADELKQDLKTVMKSFFGFNDLFVCFCNLIDAQDTVGAVEVVRCKDCKYCDTGIDEEGKRFLKCLGWRYGGTEEDDYCNYGERENNQPTVNQQSTNSQLKEVNNVS